MIQMFSTPRFWASMKARLCGPLPKCHFTGGHTEVQVLEWFMLRPASEHHQDVKRPFYR